MEWTVGAGVTPAAPRVAVWLPLLFHTSRLNRHLQPRQPAQKIRALVRHRRLRILQLQPRKPRHRTLDRDRSLHPRERRPDTKMYPLAKRDMLIALARDIESFRI